MAGNLTITFWGVRGSIPVPGPTTRKYGGNTPCVAIEAGDGLIICDAGSGIRPLGERLKQERAPVKAAILLSHLHWDHFMGLPFFAPLYDEESEILIAGLGYGQTSFKAALAKVVAAPYFPIPLRSFRARVRYKTLGERAFSLGQVRVQTFSCHHPGGALGWKFRFPNGSVVVHISDNEPSLRNRDRLLAWIRDANVMIHDAHFAPAQYAQFRGWGHSPYTYPVELAVAANIKRLFLFHHSPSADDAELADRLVHARSIVERYQSPLRVDLAREGMRVAT